MAYAELRYSYKTAAAVWAVTAVGGAITFLGPFARLWQRRREVEVYRDEVLQLRLAFENDISAVSEKHAAIVAYERHQFLITKTLFETLVF